MSIEKLDIDFSEQAKNLTPEKTSFICNKLTEVDISDDLLKSIVLSVNNGNVLAFLANHQGYLETEMWMTMSKTLQEYTGSEKFKGLCWPYSEPAVVANVGNELSKREEYYEKNGLKLLPFIRPIDRVHPKYKSYITEEMEANNKKSTSFLRNVFKRKYGIILTPEGSIKGGRINKETNEPYGMQQITDYSLTDLLLERKNVDVVPVAVSGSYKLLDSTNYKYSNEIPIWIQNGVTVMKISAQEIVPAKSLAEMDNKVDHIVYNYIAPLLVPEERGFYSQRANLENIF